LWAGVSAAIGWSFSVPGWGHPKALILQVIAAVAIAYLTRWKGVAVAAPIFWILGAPPLIIVLYHLGAHATWEHVALLSWTNGGGGIFGGLVAHLLLNSVRFRRLFGHQESEIHRDSSIRTDIIVIVLLMGVFPIFIGALYCTKTQRETSLERVKVLLTQHSSQIASCLDNFQNNEASAITFFRSRQSYLASQGETALILAPGRKILWRPLTSEKRTMFPPLSPGEIELATTSLNTDPALVNRHPIDLKLRLVPVIACAPGRAASEQFRIKLIKESSGETLLDEMLQSSGPSEFPPLPTSSILPASKISNRPDFSFVLPTQSGEFRRVRFLAATSATKMGIRVFVYTPDSTAASALLGSLHQFQFLPIVSLTIFIAVTVAYFSSRRILGAILHLQRFLDSKETDLASDELGESAPAELKPLFQSVTQLRLRTAAALAELTAAIETTGQANRETSKFVSAVSHEIRTPLNCVLSLLPALRQYPLTDFQTEYLTRAESAGKHLLSIVNDVLDLTRIEAGSLPIRREATNIVSLIEESLSVFLPLAAEQMTVLTWRFAGPIPRLVEADPLRLRQILTNLVHNALKFTLAGSVQVIARWETVTSVDEGGSLIMEIIDSGSGIEPSKLPTIFSPFVQADNPDLHTNSRGSGLGLAIVKNLVSLLSGDIQLESVVQLGTKVTVRIPLATIEPAASPLNLTVAIVRKDSLATECLRQHLTFLGCSIEWLPSIPSHGAAGRFVFMGGDQTPDRASIETQTAEELVRRGWRPVQFNTTPMFISVAATPPTGGIQLPFPLPVHRLLDLFRKESAEFPERREQEVSSLPRQAIRILVAEDNSDNRFVIEHMLNRLGYSARIVENGLQAWDAIQTEDFDIALLDIRMPGMDGLSLARNIKHRCTRPPHLIALTAGAFAADHRRCKEAGFAEVFSKPIDHTKLAQALESIPSRLKTSWNTNNFFSFKRECGDAYLASAEKIIAEIEQFFEQPPRALTSAVFADRCHSMAGAAMLIGAKTLAEVCHRLEKLAKTGTHDLDSELSIAFKMCQLAKEDLGVLSHRNDT
jgi:signal transduction histidine kinase/CheY-like chemotaxis protein